MPNIGLIIYTICWVKIAWPRLINSIYLSWLIRFNCMQIMKALTNYPNKLNAAGNKLTQWFVDKWRKPLVRQKFHQMINFKVTTSKNSLINNQVVTNIRNLTNYSGLSQNTNLQLNLLSNIQLDLIL